MNCLNFETTVMELARGQMLEARLREDALTHLKDCRRCAVRFADQQALTAGLRTVATKTALLEAPASVEERLVRAFRQRATVSQVPVRQVARGQLTRWSIAAAAALLIASTLTISGLLSTTGSSSPENGAVAEQRPLSQSIEENELPDKRTEAMPETIGSVPMPAVNQRSRPLKKRRVTVADFRRNAGRVESPVSSEVASAKEEITTDFLPLTYGGNVAPMDGGQVVRVEVPRSSLESFGLPVNVERAGERIKADVLLGHDGVARAIRFVR